MSERREIIMRRNDRWLIPASPYEIDALLEYPEGKDLWVTIRRKRSTVHNAKYWAMLKEVVESGATTYNSAADLHKVLKIELGYVKHIVRLNGDIVLEPDSTAFDRMDQDEFNRFYEGAERLIAEHFGIG